jgi:hypothetical protein
LTAIVTKPGEPQILVSDLSFGDIKIDSTASRQLTITNQGNAELRIDSLRGPSSQYYQIAFTPVIITAYSQVKFDVTFKPKAQQVYNDIIWFYSNAPEDKVKNFSVLKGNGVIISDIYDDNDVKFDLFPNPADTEINIKSELPLLSIIICDEKGRIYNTIDNINSTDYQIKTEALALGSYILKIKLANGNDLVRSIIILR